MSAVDDGVVVIRGTRAVANQYYFQDFKLFKSASASKTRGVLVALYCNVVVQGGVPCDYKLVIHTVDGDANVSIYLR